jgi:hypothetical protein
MQQLNSCYGLAGMYIKNNTLDQTKLLSLNYYSEMNIQISLIENKVEGSII